MAVTINLHNTRINRFKQYIQGITKKTGTGDASGGNFTFNFRFFDPLNPTIQLLSINNYNITITLIILQLSDTTQTNALGNRQDYPYIRIPDNTWSNFKDTNIPYIPIPTEYSNSQMCTPSTGFRITLDLGYCNNPVSTVNNSVSITYPNINLATYNTVLYWLARKR